MTSKDQPVDELRRAITAELLQYKAELNQGLNQLATGKSATELAADKLISLIQAECNRARLAESKGYCDDGHYHDYENDRAMLPSERTAELQQLMKGEQS